MPVEPVTAIANAIAEASKVIGIWMASADRRKMQAAIDAGEKYIQVNEDEEYDSMPPAKRQALLAYWKKRFYKFN